MQLRVMHRSLTSSGIALILSGAMLVLGTATALASNQSLALDPGVAASRINLSSREIQEFLLRAYQPDEVVDRSTLLLNSAEIRFLEQNLFFPGEERVDHSLDSGSSLRAPYRGNALQVSGHENVY